ncbi:MAG: hypothetical protein M0R33_03840 [Methylomonas sp.]|jgi:hypothetical protein|uniref:hypothetical protein n=1 Tax=Methylomonas sp. TaxID=418 RepID=UPI0025DDDA38|nr:hypothetical protein [Methylomonas sp.]MCK9605567.1 hypothetical protein [Methylomonas sp.]
MNENLTADIKNLRDKAQQLLLEWLESPPTDQRQKQAMHLLAEASQYLHAACVNLGLTDDSDQVK